MNRVWGRGACALALCAIVSTACTTEKSSIFIQGVIAPPESTGGACSYSVDPTSTQLLSGVYDVAISRGLYAPAMLLGNQLQATQNPGRSRTETARVHLSGVEVHVFNTDGVEVSAFTRLLSGTMEPVSGKGASYIAMLGVPLLDGKAVQETLVPPLPYGESRTVTSRVRFFGATTAGVEVESNELTFPIQLCVGCTVNFPPDSIDKARQDRDQGKPNCTASSTGGGGSSAGSAIVAPCVVGQDQAIDCRLCQGNTACDPAEAAGLTYGVDEGGAIGRCKSATFTAGVDCVETK
jgi:hypothetical protein